MYGCITLFTSPEAAGSQVRFSQSYLRRTRPARRLCVSPLASMERPERATGCVATHERRTQMREHQVLRPNPLCHSAEIACHALAIKDWRRCQLPSPASPPDRTSSELVGRKYIVAGVAANHNTSGWRVHAIGRILAMWVDRIALKHEYLRQLVDYRLDCVGSARLAGTDGH